MKISVCWIAKNEEKNIVRSINSMKDSVDEMIVVDTGSDDNTAAAARSLGARVESFEWVDDFSTARNYAVSLATGDIIMCPDADMWYDPPFGSNQRELIEKAFKSPQIEGITATLVDIDTDCGVVLNEAIFTLAYKRNAGLSYYNAIHEQLLHKNGSFMKAAHIGEIRVHHSGYSSDIVQQKAQRNFTLLELAARKEAENGGHKPLTDFYLMRENISLGKYNEAFNSFSALHSSEASVRALLPYSAITTTYFFMGLTLAGIKRTRVSRVDIYLNLVKLLKRMLPNYAGIDALELLYQVNFDHKEDLFLEAIDRLLSAYDPKSATANSDSTKAAATLCSKAAVVCMRRGELEQAFDYCVKRIMLSDIFDVDVFSILLTCIKGQPESEIILFLNSLFDIRITTKAHNLAEGLMKDGFQLIFKYYILKQIDNDNATKKHFIQLLILNGNYKEAAFHAESMKEFFSHELFSELIFLILYCSGDTSLYTVYKDHMNELHSNIFDYVSIGVMDTSESESEAKVKTASSSVNVSPISVDEGFVYSLFNQIAFFAGLSKAHQFLHLFSSNSRFCFAVVSKYYIENSMYENILLSNYGAELHDIISREVILLARIQSGKYKEALAQIIEEFTEYKINKNTLNHLLTLSIKADPVTASEARQLYDLHVFLFDEYTDYEDVIRTGLVFDTLSKKDKKRYAEMDLKGLEQMLRSDDKKTAHLTYLMTIDQAANIYAKKEMTGMALKCRLRLFACGYKPDETLGHLVALFEKIGNKQLSRDLYGIKLSRS